MAFRERSAWVMGIALILAGAFYLKLVIGDAVPPAIAAVPFVFLVVVLSVAVQIVLAVMSPREASGPVDERERLISDKAAHFSSYVLATGVVVGLGLFMLSPDGTRLFHIVLTTLILGQIAEYGAQIFLFRRNV